MRRLSLTHTVFSSPEYQTPSSTLLSLKAIQSVGWFLEGDLVSGFKSANAFVSQVYFNALLAMLNARDKPSGPMKGQSDVAVNMYRPPQVSIHAESANPNHSESQVMD